MELNQRPLKGLSLRERREYLWILKLRMVPQFRQLMDRLDRGHSVWATAEWFMSQPNRGDLSDCSFETARKYLNCLSIRMKKEREKHPKMDLSQRHTEAVRTRMETNVSATLQGMPVPGPTDIGDISKLLAKELEALDAIAILKHCALIQKERVAQIRKLETTSSIIFPFGDKSVRVLQQIGTALWQVQTGEALLRSKNAWPTNMGDVSRATNDLLPEVKEIAELDPVDQNLIREAFSKTIDLLQEEAGRGQYSYRVEVEQRRTEAPEGPSST